MPVFLPQIHALEKALPVHNKRDGVQLSGGEPRSLLTLLSDLFSRARPGFLLLALALSCAPRMQ